MQEKLIALAIASLMTAPAFAQSNVALYGTIDFGFTSLGSNDGNGVKSRNAIDSGISKSNRIGFRGTEDLGNGLKAVFVLEEGLNGDQGAMWKTTNRQSYAGLAGGFGTIAAGRQNSPQHVLTGNVDPFGKNGLGSAGNVLLQDKRLNNLLAYISPDWGGFSLIAGWSFNGTRASVRGIGPGGTTVSFGGGDEALENDGDVQLWAIAPSFKWDKLFVGANYHNAKVKGAHSDNIKALDVYDLYVSYDFGFVKMGGMIGRRVSKKGATATDKDVKLQQAMLGATFKITSNDSILASYNYARENSYNDGMDDRAKIGQWAIGFEHAFSKRTVLYVQFAMQHHNDAYKDRGFRSIYTDSQVGSVGSSNLNGDETLGYRRGFAAGFRHDF